MVLTGIFFGQKNRNYVKEGGTMVLGLRSEKNTLWRKKRYKYDSVNVLILYYVNLIVNSL